MNRRSFLQSCSAAVLSVASIPAFAVVDLTAVTAAFNTDMIPALVAIGGLLIFAAVTAITYKWIKGMLFS